MGMDLYLLKVRTKKEDLRKVLTRIFSSKEEDSLVVSADDIIPNTFLLDLTPNINPYDNLLYKKFNSFTIQSSDWYYLFDKLEEYYLRQGYDDISIMYDGIIKVELYKDNEVVKTIIYGDVQLYKCGWHKKLTEYYLLCDIVEYKRFSYFKTRWFKSDINIFEEDLPLYYFNKNDFLKDFKRIFRDEYYNELEEFAKKFNDNELMFILNSY